MSRKKRKPRISRTSPRSVRINALTRYIAQDQIEEGTTAEPEEDEPMSTYAVGAAVAVNGEADAPKDRIRLGAKMVRYLRSKGLSYAQCNKVLKMMSLEPAAIKAIYVCLKTGKCIDPNSFKFIEQM